MKNYYLLFVCCVFICGILLASSGIFEDIAPLIFVISILTLFTFLALSIKKDALFLATFFLLVFLLGALQYSLFNKIDGRDIKNYIDYPVDKVFMRGEIVSDPTENKKGKKNSFKLECMYIKLQDSWAKTSGLALVNIYKKKSPVFRYGDIVLLEGSLQKPSAYKGLANFDYSEFLANKRIYSILSVKKDCQPIKKIGEDKKAAVRVVRAIYSVRTRLKRHIEKFLKVPYDSILAAVLVGRREGIPPGLRDLFAKTGTIHILAISGLHVGIIYFALRVILKIFRIQKNFSIILSIIFLICFTALTGARASIVRASTMFSILALGEVLKRKMSVFNLIGISCFVTLLVNPNQVFDIGFILSYTAVLSIIGITPVFYKSFLLDKALKPQDSPLKKLKYYILKPIFISLAVWLGLLPLIAHYFGLVSPVTIFANLIVVPLLFMVMGSGLLLISLGFISKFLALLFAESAWFFLFLLIRGVKFLKNIPLSYFEVKPPSIQSMILYYMAILALLGTWNRRQKAKS